MQDDRASLQALLAALMPRRVPCAANPSTDATRQTISQPTMRSTARPAASMPIAMAIWSSSRPAILHDVGAT